VSTSAALLVFSVLLPEFLLKLRILFLFGGLAELPGNNVVIRLQPVSTRRGTIFQARTLSALAGCRGFRPAFFLLTASASLRPCPGFRLPAASFTRRCRGGPVRFSPASFSLTGFAATCPRRGSATATSRMPPAGNPLLFGEQHLVKITEQALQLAVQGRYLLG
jgi:hypothetical protein